MSILLCSGIYQEVSGGRWEARAPPPPPLETMCLFYTCSPSSLLILFFLYTPCACTSVWTMRVHIGVLCPFGYYYYAFSVEVEYRWRLLNKFHAPARTSNGWSCSFADAKCNMPFFITDCVHRPQTWIEQETLVWRHLRLNDKLNNIENIKCWHEFTIRGQFKAAAPDECMWQMTCWAKMGRCAENRPRVAGR